MRLASKGPPPSGRTGSVLGSRYGPDRGGVDCSSPAPPLRRGSPGHFPPVRRRPKHGVSASGHTLPAGRDVGHARYGPAVLEPSRGLESPGGPFLAIRGARESSVTVSAVTGSPGMLIIEASWIDEISGSRSTSLTVRGFQQAREIAHRWTRQIDVGVEPD